jgi:hypothetical protein
MGRRSRKRVYADKMRMAASRLQNARDRVAQAEREVYAAAC